MPKNLRKCRWKADKKRTRGAGVMAMPRCLDCSAPVAGDHLIRCPDCARRLVAESSAVPLADLRPDSPVRRLVGAIEALQPGMALQIGNGDMAASRALAKRVGSQLARRGKRLTTREFAGRLYGRVVDGAEWPG